jgi:ribonuclease-3
MSDCTERYEYGIKTDLGEGDFSNIKSKLSDKKNLSESMMTLGLEKYLIMGEGDEKLGIAHEPSVMEDLFESIVGAIYVDCGMNMDTVIKSVKVMLDLSHYSATTTSPSPSAKNALQEWCADKKHRFPAPIYKTLCESGPDHKRTYERAVYIGDRLVGVGKGKNQKIADAKAAEEALTALIREYERERSKASIGNTELACQKLKEYSQKNKKPTPEFRDLGETENSTARAREYAIECRFDGKITTAAAPDKREARCKAAKAMLDMLTKVSKTQEKSTPVSKKCTKKVVKKVNKPAQKKIVKK